MTDGMPPGAVLRDLSPTYNEQTLPRSLRAPQTLPPETWAQVVADEGAVLLLAGGGAAPVRVTPGQPAGIAPGTVFRLADANGPGRFHLLYYHTPRLTQGAELSR
jgi:hypothetical protein